MPIVSMVFGIIVRMYADDHNPPHMHGIPRVKSCVLVGR